MAYIVPRVLINQEFNQIPVFGDQPLAALIVGPQYNLHRYSVAAEKASTYVGAYVNSVNTPYSFPAQAAGTYVDADYVKVYFEKAQIEYFPKTELGVTTADISPVASVQNPSVNYHNYLKADNLVFTTANEINRSADFSARDVEPGDIVVISNGTTTFNTRIKGLHASRVAAAIDAATNDSGNAATHTAVNSAASVSWTGAGAQGAATAPSNTSTAYVGYIADGVVSDTYKVTCTNATTKTFTVVASSGLVNTTASIVANVLTLDATGSNDLKLNFSTSSAPAVDDAWSITVYAAVTQRIPVGAGTYAGAKDVTYRLVVVRGGAFYSGSNAATCARIAISSNNVDGSATVNVASGTQFIVGSYGLTAAFSAASSGGGLVAGDIYYLPVVAGHAGATNVIETYDSLPADFVNEDSSYEITSLRYVKNYAVNQVIPGNDIDLNYTVDTTNQTITVNEGITTTHPSITLGGDVPLALDVISASVYVEHRDLVVTNSISIGSVTSTDEVSVVLGTVTPDNTLAQGVYDAVLNSAGVVVYYAAVPTNDLAGYTHVLGLAEKSKDYYGLVPLTFDVTVIEAFVGHVNSMSTAANAKWRKTWISAQLQKSGLVYDLQTDGSPWLGTISEDSLSTGTQYTLVTVADATFISDGVRPTDKVLINFATAADGSLAYDEYVVAEVRTETTLVLVSGPASPINLPVKTQVKRIYTKDEQITQLALVGSEYNNRRVNVVFPDSAKDGLVVKPGYLIAAALAGLRSGTVPHQGLTNTQVLGITQLAESVITFSETQLNRLAEQGYFIVTQATLGSTPYIRHQLTTDSSNLNLSEDSITTNVDSISYGLFRALEPYIGVYNINTDALLSIRESVNNELRYRAQYTRTVRAGNQLISYEIVAVAQNPTFKDHVDVTVKIEVPYPVNFITLTLFV